MFPKSILDQHPNLTLVEFRVNNILRFKKFKKQFLNIRVDRDNMKNWTCEFDWQEHFSYIFRHLKHQNTYVKHTLAEKRTNVDVL